MKTSKLLFAVAVTAAVVSVETAIAQKSAEFEVASIKPSPPGPNNSESRFDPGGTFTATGTPLKALLQVAYGVNGFEIAGGPKWLESDRYDVIAKPAASENLSEEQMKPMIQQLLVDRFRLKIHRKTRELPVYSMVVGKNGPKLTANTGAPGPGWGMGPGQLDAHKISMAMLASALESQLDRNIIDKTGIRGDYDVKLDWGRDDSVEAGPAIFTALQEQLGLRLESTKGPVSVIVIDRAERPSAN